MGNKLLIWISVDFRIDREKAITKSTELCHLKLQVLDTLDASSRRWLMVYIAVSLCRPPGAQVMACTSNRGPPPGPSSANSTCEGLRFWAGKQLARGFRVTGWHSSTPQKNTFPIWVWVNTYRYHF